MHFWIGYRESKDCCEWCNIENRQDHFAKMKVIGFAK